VRKEKKEKINKSAASGVVALIFLILGFQLAIFVVKVVERPSPAVADVPDVTDVPDMEANEMYQEGREDYEDLEIREDREIRRGPKQQRSQKTRLGGYPPPSGTSYGRSESRQKNRSYESFQFDPNTVTVEELTRLGLTQGQAQAIDNYRTKGGRFRSREDFKKMYTVSDTLYQRLEPFIEIAKIELNSADSAALVSLKGIGGYYAMKIIEYRNALGGFTDKSQLLEIKGIDSERYAGFQDYVRVDTSLIRQLDIWGLPQDSLSRHPYIGEKRARAIVRFREVYDTTRWHPDSLVNEHVLDTLTLRRLRPYIR